MKSPAAYALLMALVCLGACQSEPSSPASGEVQAPAKPQWQPPVPAAALPPPAIAKTDECQPRQLVNSPDREPNDTPLFENQAFHGMVAIDEIHGVMLKEMYGKNVLVVNMVTGETVDDYRIKKVRTARSFSYNICHDAIYLPSIVGPGLPTVAITRLSTKDGSQDSLELPDVLPTETPTSPVIFDQTTGTGYFAATSRQQAHELYSVKTDLTLRNHGKIEGVPVAYNEKHHSVLSVITRADDNKSLNYYKLMDDGSLVLVSQGPVLGKSIIDVAIVGHGYNVITASSDSAAAYSSGGYSIQEYALSDLTVKTGSYEPRDEIVDIAYTSDGRFLSAADRRYVRVFDTLSKEQLVDERMSCESTSTSRIQDISFSRDSSTLFVVMHCGIGAKLDTEILSVSLPD